MKTVEEIEEENGFRGVFESKNFLAYVQKGLFNEYDGGGYFHDGENETELSVFDRSVTEVTFDEYPYVCWYNK